MRPDVEKFFARYSAALSSGDLPGIVSCFDPPTVIVDEVATTLMIDHRQLNDYFMGMEERYRALGAFTASATVATSSSWPQRSGWWTFVGTRSMSQVRRPLLMSRRTSTCCALCNPKSR